MMSRHTRSFVWLLALTLDACIRVSIVPGVANAEAEPTRVVYADTVRVWASKVRSRLADLATSASIVSPEQIRQGTARSMHDVLAQVPGMHVLDLSGSGTGGAVEARGFAAQGTTSSMLVLIDGVPLNDPESGRVDWNALSPSHVERVELLRGPSSFLYGSSTLAGLVNIVTAAPRERTSAWGEFSGGSFERRSAAGGAGWSAPRARGALEGSLSDEEGARDNSSARLLSGHGMFATTLTPSWELTARVQGSRADRRVAGPLPAPAWKNDPDTSASPDDRRKESIAHGNVELTGRLNPQLTLTVLTGGILRQLDAFETIIPVGGLGRTSRTRAAHGELRAHWLPVAGAAPSVLAGVETRIARLKSRYAESDPDRDPILGAGDVDRSVGGAYLVLERASECGLGVAAGARVDWTRSSVDDPTDNAPRSANDDQRAVSPSVAFSWASPGQANAWLSYAGAFKTPELEQLYDSRPYDLGFGPIRISNSALQPQRDDHWELGARKRVGRTWVDGAAYYARSRNELGFDYENFRISNIARSRHAGFEAQIALARLGGLSGSASYAYTRATFEGGDFDGKQINTVPKHLAFLRASFEHRAKGSVSLELQNVSGQWIDEANTLALPDYTLVHIGMRQSAGPIEIFGSIRNLGNRRFAPVGYVTLNEVGEPLPLYFPGVGRAFSVGVRVGRMR
ncbi:MAG: TonB-dependent receptor [Candidatus Eisenbacteria bacterium]